MPGSRRNRTNLQSSIDWQRARRQTPPLPQALVGVNPD
jgi:hypothetical protein